MRLDRKRSDGEGRVLRIALLFTAVLVLFSAPSIYFSTQVSRGAEMADLLQILSMNTTSAGTLFGQDSNQTSQSSAWSRPGGSGGAAIRGVSPPSREKPLVAVVVCTKSSKNWRNVKQTSLHTLLIPSVEKTVTVHDLRKYRIEFVIGFDQGDTFWEQASHRAELMGESVFPISFISIPKNPERPHKIPFNQLCRAAYEYGADYIVRVNDDSEFKTPDWISKSVAQLQQFTPPNLGVVGPTCKQGNTDVSIMDDMC